MTGFCSRCSVFKISIHSLLKINQWSLDTNVKSCITSYTTGHGMIWFSENENSDQSKKAVHERNSKRLTIGNTDWNYFHYKARSLDCFLIIWFKCCGPMGLNQTAIEQSNKFLFEKTLEMGEQSRLVLGSIDGRNVCKKQRNNRRKRRRENEKDSVMRFSFSRDSTAISLDRFSLWIRIPPLIPLQILNYPARFCIQHIMSYEKMYQENLYTQL